MKTSQGLQRKILFLNLKIIISILIILSLIIPLGGSFIVLQIKKQIIKAEIKHRIIAGIDRNELIVLKFTKNDAIVRLNWEESKEFEYEGEMYDVVESIENNDTITFWCWWDRAETKLNKQLNDLTAKAAEQNPLNQENNKRIIKFLSSLYSQNIFIFKRIDDRAIILRPADNSIYYSISIPPPIPPP